MVNRIYAKAYNEVLEIINYFPKDEYSKIPEYIIYFMENNKDLSYDFKINPQIDLNKQNISKEANAIIIYLYQNYFATEKQKNQINEILKLNELKFEQEKVIKYKLKDIFKNKNDKNILKVEPQNNALLEYKKGFFEKFKKIILRIFGN